MGENETLKLAERLNILGTLLFPTANIMQFLLNRGLLPKFYTDRAVNEKKMLVKADTAMGAAIIIFVIGGMHHHSGVVNRNNRTTVHGLSLGVFIWGFFRFFALNDDKQRDWNAQLRFTAVFYLYLTIIEYSGFLFTQGDTEGKKTKRKDEKRDLLVKQRRTSMIFAVICLAALSYQ